MFNYQEHRPVKKPHAKPHAKVHGKDAAMPKGKMPMNAMADKKPPSSEGRADRTMKGMMKGMMKKED